MTSAKESRRQEIKKKEAFQLKFQLAISQNKKQILNWLPKTTEKSELPDELPSKSSFFDLPVLSNGKGLSELENDSSSNISSVRDYVNSNEGMRKQPIGNKRENRTGSKAMSALMNKMRSNDRVKQNSNDGQSSSVRVQKPHKIIKKTEPTVDDSDDEESKSKQITGKSHLSFGGKKGKQRPF